jgi:hypothetical protein
MAKCKGGVCQTSLRNQKQQAKVQQKQAAVQAKANRGIAPQFADSPEARLAPHNSFWGGSKGGVQNFPLNTQSQNNALDQLLQYATQNIGNPGESAGIKKMLDLWNRNISPGIAERFTAFGNGPRSSGAQAAQNAAGRRLAEDVPGLQRQEMFQWLPLLQMGLAPRYQSIHHQPKPGVLKNVPNALASGIGGAITGGLTGGPWGAVAGGLASGAKGLFSGKEEDLGKSFPIGKGFGGGQQQEKGDQLSQLLELLNYFKTQPGAEQGGGPLGAEALRELIAALVGNEDLKKTLMAGG